MDKLSFLEIVYEYTVLRAKETDPLIRLAPEEVARLGGLECILRAERGELDGRRRMPRVPCPLPLQFTAAGGFGSGRARDMSGLGLGMEVDVPPEVGETVLVHLADTDGHFEYLFPARVIWRRLGDRPTVGMAFDGMPSRTLLPGRRMVA